MDDLRRVRWARAGAIALVLSLSACLGSPRTPPAPARDPERGPRYVRTVAAGGEATRDEGGDVLVSGRILTQAGGPAGGSAVALERVQSGFFPAPCFIGCKLPPECAYGDEATSGPDGRFFLKMCRPARDLSLTVSPPEEGGRVHLPLFIEGDRTLLPTLRLWRPLSVYHPSSGTVWWQDLPLRGFGKLDRYELTFRSDIGRPAIVNAMWYWFDAVAADSVDPRVLEDTSGKIFVTAHTNVRLRRPCRPSCSRSFRPSFTPGGVPYEGPGAPPSRGRPCFVGAPGGRELAPCYLTDGRFFRTGFDHYCSEQLPCGSDPRWLGIDLGARRRIELVVARDCAFCRVFVSADGRRWRHLLATSYDSGLDKVSVYTPDPRERYRYVRVSDPEDLAELSYW